jgi:hypothetical protein
MLGEKPLIAMKDVDFFVPETEIEVSLYAAFCHGLSELAELDLDQRAALATALDAFRAAYHGRWVAGTAFLTDAELVFIPAVAHRTGRPVELAVRLPLTGILEVNVASSPWRDTLALSTIKGRVALRGFMARRFGARLDLACVARLGRVSAASALHPQPV